MEELELLDSLKQRFKTEKIAPYGQVIPVPAKLFDPSWEATLERQGHRVFVNVRNGESFSFVSVRKSKPRQVDLPKTSTTRKSTAAITQELFLKRRSQPKKVPQREWLPQGKLVQIPVELIKHSTSNPREHFKEADLNALATTIRRLGLLQPILVKELHDSYGYEVVIGERRFRACKKGLN